MLIGGRAFPRLPRDWRTELNVKVRDMGMRCALSSKYAQGQLTVVDTADATQLEQAMQAHGWTLNDARTLILHGNGENISLDETVKEHASKLRARFNGAHQTSVYELLCHDHVVLTRQAVSELEHRYWCY